VTSLPGHQSYVSALVKARARISKALPGIIAHFLHAIKDFSISNKAFQSPAKILFLTAEMF
jgi:hypothetical protein